MPTVRIKVVTVEGVWGPLRGLGVLGLGFGGWVGAWVLQEFEVVILDFNHGPIRLVEGLGLRGEGSISLRVQGPK